jgi:iron complex outermembrane receptor protein
MKKFRLNTIAIGIVAALSTSASTVFANENNAKDDKIERIMVTATKRNADVQEVSIAVTALNSEALKEGGIEDISRLEHLVPGMRFGQSGNEVRIAMRGTRTNNVGTEAEQVVGIFEDGVYVATTTQALGAYVDIDRVEVLRGPQGTLYGKNTFGGTINIHTKAPSFDEVTGYISGVYGDYDRAKLEGAINIPLGDTVAARFAYMTDKHDGYIENTHIAGTSDDLNDKDIQYFRASLRWSPSADLDVTLRGGRSTSKGNSSAIWGYQQIGAYVDGELVNGHQYLDRLTPVGTSASDEGPWKVKRNMASGVDIETTFYTLKVQYELPFATLEYVGNTTDFDGSQFFDPDYSDGGDPANSGFTGWTSTQETESHELQLISNNDSELEWLLGLYKFDQTSRWNWLETNDGVLGVPHWDRQGDYITESFGAFANATYSVDEDNRLVGGIRYAEDSKQQKDPLDWSVFPPVPMAGEGEKGEWDDILWKLAYEHDLNDDSMVYGQVSTGYRAGGINAITLEGVPQTYDPETVTAYEAGYKSVWLDDSLTFNVSLYLNKYENMQAQSFVIIDDSATEFTENGGSLDALGLELELNWDVSDQFNIGATAAIMDAEFGDYNVAKIDGLGDAGGRQDLADPLQPFLNLKGWSPALAPKVTLGLQAGYTFTLEGGSTLKPFLQTSYTSDYYASDINLGGVMQEAHTKTDLRLIWKSANGEFELQAFVLNIENEAVLNRVAVFNPGDRAEIASLQANWNNPRTWGLSASYNF